MSATATAVKALAETRSQLEGLGDKIRDLRTKDRTEEVRTELRDTIDQVTELDTLMRIAQRAAEAELGMQSGGPQGGTRVNGQAEYRSAGQLFTESDEYRNWGGSGALEVRTLVTNAGGITFSTAGGTGPGLLRPLGTPVIPPASVYRQRLFIRDVLSVQQTGLASVPYIKELNAVALSSAASGAQFVGEGQQKAEVGIDFRPDDAPIRKLAAWIPCTYEILQDAPTLRGYIDGRLSYMLALAEERGIIGGNGTSPNLRGLLNSSIGTQTFSGDPFVSLGLAMGKLEVAQGTPTFIAMHPADFWQAQTTRFVSQFAGATAGLNNAPFGTPNTEIWGVPVVRTVAITPGTALVGCRDGAVILDREQPVVRVGDQHLDYFTTNRVAILTEERLGLAVHRPDWFILTAIA